MTFTIFNINMKNIIVNVKEQRMYYNILLYFVNTFCKNANYYIEINIIMLLFIHIKKYDFLKKSLIL